MKILVVSDTHGRIEPFVNELEKHKDAKHIFFLGDMVEDAYDIQDYTDIPIKIVRGNNDYDNDETPWHMLVIIEGHRILLTHGHKEKINYGYSNLVYKAEECDADIVFYGHTHIYDDTIIEYIRIINPGSAGYDRGGEFESYVVLDITEEEVKICRVEL